MSRDGRRQHDEHGQAEPLPGDWAETNQRVLAAELARIGQALRRQIAQPEGSHIDVDRDPLEVVKELEGLRSELSAPSALDAIADGFALTPFERDLLLLCAGLDLEPSFAGLFATVHGDPRRPWPSLGLALSVLPGAHWSALLPDAPLRRWHMVEIGPGDSLTSSPLKLDERILHHILGLSPMDSRLEGCLTPLPAPLSLPESHRAAAQRIAQAWARGSQGALRPGWLLCGEDRDGSEAIAAAACAEAGVQLFALHAESLPEEAAERELMMRLWEREAVLSPAALLLDCHEIHDSAVLKAAAGFMERVQGLVLISSRDPIVAGRRTLVRVDVERPSTSEQRGLWQEALGPLAAQLNGNLEPLLAQFRLSAAQIRGIGAEAAERLGQDPAHSLGGLVWRACRVQSRPRLEDLAQRVEARAGWDDLVIPTDQRQLLRDVAVHVRQRTRVYEAWGFAGKSTRGLGISALFAGASGTGKTMAAEVLARELDLDLYRIDLSQVVSKYIGETEKNLRRVFDAADEGGAILLFDEADALFGKRSEVKDSHDRYANVEVSYLLQRMEAYRGLAVLTTNLKNALDSAFLRRIRFVIQFPFPDSSQRAEIWRRLFPARTPVEGLDYSRLARLNVTGGNIRNIGLNAAFLAAEEDAPVRMSHLLRAAKAECLKLEKSITDAEIAGWS